MIQIRRQKSTSLCSLISCMLLAGGILSVQAEQPEVGFSPKGLSSFTIGKFEILANGQPSIPRFLDKNGKPVRSQVQKSSFDEATKTYQATSTWGELVVKYEESAQWLGAQVRVENRSTETISGFTLDLASFDHLGSGRQQPPSFCFEEPAFTFFDGSAGSLVLGAPGRTSPLQLGLNRDEKSGRVAARVGFGGGRVLQDQVVMDQSLEPGQAQSFSLVLRGSGKPAASLALRCK